MGWNTVAVLYNDFVGIGEMPEPIARAIRNLGGGPTARDVVDTSFRYGRVISTSHADYNQVAVVGGNTGHPLVGSPMNGQVFRQIKDWLEDNGYRVVKTRKPRT